MSDLVLINNASLSDQKEQLEIHLKKPYSAFNAAVQKARAKSALMPYLLYKRCPNVLKRLHKILRGAWGNLKISEQWMSADGVHIPKERNSTEIN